MPPPIPEGPAGRLGLLPGRLLEPIPEGPAGRLGSLPRRLREPGPWGVAGRLGSLPGRFLPDSTSRIQHPISALLNDVRTDQR